MMATFRAVSASPCRPGFSLAHAASSFCMSAYETTSTGRDLPEGRVTLANGSGISRSAAVHFQNMRRSLCTAWGPHPARFLHCATR